MIITKKLFSIFLAVFFCITTLCLPASAEDSDYYKIKIPSGFEIVSQFSNGSCFVNRGYEYGLLSTDGDYVPLGKINNYAPLFDFTSLTNSAYIELYREDYFDDFEDEIPFGAMYLFKNGEIYNQVTPTPNGNYIVKKSSGYGILDSSGKVIVECIYHYIESDFSDGLLPVAIDYNGEEDTYSWKYIKQDGTDLNDEVYLSATPFYGGYANVTFEDNGKIMHGIINTNGEVVYSAENRYDQITQFYGNCAFGISYAEEEDYISKIQVFDSTGTVRDTIYSDSYLLPQPVVVLDDLLQFLMADKIKYNYNLVLIPALEGSEIDFESSQCMLYNTKDFVLYDEVYTQVNPQVSDYIVVANLEDKCGYLDKNGNQVIECQYVYADNFSEGLASVSTDGENLFYITEDGEPADIGTYTYTGGFTNGVAPVAKQDLLFGLIDTNGNTVAEFKYYYISSFINGIAMVFETEDKCGLINTNGDLIAPCEYDLAAPIGIGNYPFVIKSDGDKDLVYSLDQSGNKLIDADYDIILSLGEGMVLCGNTEDETPVLYRAQISDSTQKILDFKSALAELPGTLTDDDIDQVNNLMNEYNNLNYADQQIFYRNPVFWEVQKYHVKKELGDEYLVGDIDGDDEVTVSDIIALRGIILKRFRYTPKQEVLADINNDGDISVVDIVALRKIIMEAE